MRITDVPLFRKAAQACLDCELVVDDVAPSQLNEFISKHGSERLLEEFQEKMPNKALEHGSP